MDLIEKVREKVLLRVAESGEDGNRWSTEVLWAPDSKRFALMHTTERRSSAVSVYFREGDSFREIALPTLPEATIPPNIDGDKDQDAFGLPGISWRGECLVLNSSLRAAASLDFFLAVPGD